MINITILYLFRMTCIEYLVNFSIDTHTHPFNVWNVLRTLSGYN